MNPKELLLKFRRPLIIALHLALAAGAYILAFYLRFDLRITDRYWRLIARTLPLLACIKLVVLGYFNLYSGLWRYASIDDIWRLLKANILATLSFILAVTFLFGMQEGVFTLSGFPRSVFILDFILSFSFMAGVRFANRLIREKFRPEARTRLKKGLIVGAGEAGIMVLREARINPKAGIDIAGFIDDDRRKLNLCIQGVNILGASRDIPSIVEEYGIEEVIIAIPSARGEEIRRIVSYCKPSSVKIRIVPGLQKIISGDLEVKPRDIRPEDLLGREVVTINEEEVKDYLFEKTVLVTGAGGSIGSALCRQIVNFNPREVLLFDHNENNVYYLGLEFLTKYRHIKFRTIIGDIRDIGLLKNVFSSYKPQVIFHAAAHKHVPLMEENPVAAVKNNIIGSRNLIYAANHYKVERFIFISTDKAVNPTSVMGMTKRVVEMVLQAKAKLSKTKYMAVRFGNVLGSDGSVIPLFKKQIEEGGPLTVTHPEVKRYFMSINEAAQLVLQAGSMGKSGEIFILDMGEQIKILDLAKEMVILYGLKPDEDIRIEYIGLRPGEKLFEETLLDTEKDKATKAKKIYIAQLNTFNPKVLHRRIKDLENSVKVMDSAAIVKKLKEAIGI
ncbi:MAG: nucleoside-diphosphate sugar epimerase/dehydratase [Candidatus Omnitrophota bacterium]|jgi:FlaA1/EpsC-like NDP-sugar epimerase